MKVYLVRHGEAKSSDVDPRKPLSERGEAQARAVAGFLKPMGLAPAEVWHSGKARAEGTAEILLGALSGEPEVKMRHGLAPDDAPKPVADELASLGFDVVIVGHMPFMGRMASVLLFGDESKRPVGFHTVTAACFASDGEGAWSLDWAVHPGVLG